MVTYPSRLSRAPAESMEVCYSKTNGKKRKALAAKVRCRLSVDRELIHLEMPLSTDKLQLEGLPQEDEDDLMGAKRWSKRKRGRPVERPQKSQMKSLKVGEVKRYLPTLFMSEYWLKSLFQDSECPFLPHVEPVALARDGVLDFIFFSFLLPFAFSPHAFSHIQWV